LQISPTIAGSAAANTYTTNSIDLAAIAGSCPDTATCRNNAINIGSYAIADADQTSVAINITDQYNATGNHYGICFDCDGTFTSSYAANGINWGNDANMVTLYRGASDTLTTDDRLVVLNSGWTITAANQYGVSIAGTITSAAQNRNFIAYGFTSTVNLNYSVGSSVYQSAFLATPIYLISSAGVDPTYIALFRSEPALRVSGDIGARTVASLWGYKSNVTLANIGTGTTTLTLSQFVAYDSWATSVGGVTTLTKLYHYRAMNPTASGTIVNQYGLYIDGLSSATNNYGIYIYDQNAGTTAYGICFDCDSTYDNSTAKNGITWGTDANTVTLYRSAADTLKTDNNFIALSYQDSDGFSTANTAGLCWDNSGSSYIYDCNGAPTDLAENYGTDDPSIEAGDLVISTGQAEQVPDPNEGKPTTKAWIAKSSASYDSKLIGVVSTNPNQVYGEDGLFTARENPKPVSMAGRVPVKVSTENGPIQPGDPLTSSSTPGVAMKATHSGPIVGKALESYDNSDPTAVGKIVVFVSVGWYVEPLGGGSGQLSDINNLTDLSVVNLVASSINTELLMIGNNKLSLAADGSLSIEGNTKITGDLNVLGSITTKNITAGKINIVTGSAEPNGKSSDSTGSATIPSGELEVTIETTAITSKSRVFVTAISPTGGQALVVSEKKAGEGFTVNLDHSFGTDINFDWFIIN
jgi:hypothetical protein